MNMHYVSAAAARMSAGSQMCRSHFHPSTLPWLADTTKPMVGHESAWCNPFGTSSSGSSGTTNNSADEKPPSLSPASTSHHSATAAAHHLFSFPPTPPKDATPDSVTAASTALTSSAAATSSATSASVDYQNAAAAVAHAAAMGVAFMHHQDPTASSLCVSNSSSLDIKPGVNMLNSSASAAGTCPGGTNASGGVKLREGTSSTASNNSSAFSTSSSAASPAEVSPRDSSSSQHLSGPQQLHSSSPVLHPQSSHGMSSKSQHYPTSPPLQPSSYHHDAGSGSTPSYMSYQSHHLNHHHLNHHSMPHHHHHHPAAMFSTKSLSGHHQMVSGSPGVTGAVSGASNSKASRTKSRSSAGKTCAQGDANRTNKCS